MEGEGCRASCGLVDSKKTRPVRGFVSNWVPVPSIQISCFMILSRTTACSEFIVLIFRDSFGNVVSFPLLPEYPSYFESMRVLSRGFCCISLGPACR